MKPWGKALIGFGVIVVLALGALVAWAWQERRAELAKIEYTQGLLERLARDLKARAGAPPVARGGAAWNGQEALRAHMMDERHADLPIHLSSDEILALLAGGLLDAWGNTIRYRCPGPLHSWDVWSFGPNGQDESGAGDDLIVGG